MFSPPRARIPALAGTLDERRSGATWLELEALAQIETADVRIPDQIVRAAGEQHLATIDDAGAVDDIERLSDIMVGDEDADITFLQFADQVANVLDRDRIDPREGFIEQHDRG